MKHDYKYFAFPLHDYGLPLYDNILYTLFYLILPNLPCQNSNSYSTFIKIVSGEVTMGIILRLRVYKTGDVKMIILLAMANVYCNTVEQKKNTTHFYFTSWLKQI